MDKGMDCLPSPQATPQESAMAPEASRYVEPPETSLKWRFEEHWSGEMARFDLGGLKVYVRDCDGDYSFWNIRRGRKGHVLAEGESYSPYHWETCLYEAEQALRKIVADRIAELRGKPHSDQASGEPISWESTTEAFKPYLTESQYQRLRPAYQKWYRPYRCAHCARVAAENALSRGEEPCSSTEGTNPSLRGKI